MALECARQLKEAAAGGGAVDPTTKLGVPKQVIAACLPKPGAILAAAK